jgi:S-adenosylhomocysteine hydrolase
VEVSEDLIKQLVKMTADCDSACTQVVASTNDDVATAAIIVLRGEDTQQYLDAINAVSKRLEDESDD